ncbi:hypothetical protein GCK32_012516 [Trichostrongylus colubriformis]|uniref:G protein-coupled receptor n=1 Tax=Trichostrongylus colubriformis TaxID=6319 RepID=A0AAN8FR80_TRICO
MVTVLTTPLLIRFCHALDKSALFHRNLIIITKYHFCTTYMVQIIRILLILFELGIIRVGGFAGIDKVCMFSTGVCISFAIILVILHRRDRRRLEKFVMKDSFRYELSTRFQLVENLRVLKIIMSASVAFSIWLPFPCIMLITVYGWFLPNTHSGQIVYATFELILSLSIAGLFLFSVMSLGALPKKVQTLKCVKMFQNKVNNGDRQLRGVNTEKYFQQLHSAWA